MRALARASDEIAPSDSFEKKTGITTNAKRVPTLVGDFLAGSGSHTASKGERHFPQRGNPRANPWGGAEGNLPSRNCWETSRRCGTTHGAIPVGWSMGGPH